MLPDDFCRRARRAGRANRRPSLHPGNSRRNSSCIRDLACRHRNIFAGAIGKHPRASHASRAIFYFTGGRREDRQCKTDSRGRNNNSAGAGIGASSKWEIASASRLERSFHLPALSLPVCRSSFHEFSSAALDAAHAGVCIRGTGFRSCRVSGSNPRALSFLQLWRLHVDSVGEAVGFPWDENVVPLQIFFRCVILRANNTTEENQPKGELVIQTIAMPKDTNPNGDIFGGWLMSQMDLGSGILAAKTAQARVVTVAMKGMSFLHPVRVGDTVACYAWVERIGRTSMVIPVEVWVRRYMHGKQIRVTRGVFTHVAVDDSGRPIPVKREAP